MIKIVSTSRWKALQNRIDDRTRNLRDLQGELGSVMDQQYNMELHLKRAQVENNILTAVICVLCILCIVIIEVKKSKVK
jgi:hypothetical protein